MAHLVPPINMLPPSEERIIEFKGLNRNPVIEEGEMADMLNLTSDRYPTLAPRKLREEMTLPTGVVRPVHIISKHSRICLVGVDQQDHVHFYYDGERIDRVTGLGANSIMVSINTKVCFFPQKTYIEIVRNGDEITIGAFGSLEASSTLSGSVISIGAEYTSMIVPDASQFGYDDAVTLTGILEYEEDGSPIQTDCNVSAVIEAIDGHTLMFPSESFIELTAAGATIGAFSGTIERTMPDLDYVIEWNNRLWGVSNIDNTIYACKLGDPKNWQYFQGTGLDSYYAQQGTDGLWTGVAAYSNHVIFFKEDSMARVYGSAPSNFQLTNSLCYGVEEGSSRSVVTLNDTVFYKSKVGIMCYYGTTPVLISDKFNERTRNAVGGTDGSKYFVSLQRESGGFELLVYDVKRSVWHKEDNIRMRSCSTINNRLYFTVYGEPPLVCEETGVKVSPWLLCNDGVLEGQAWVVGSDRSTENYENMKWMAVFGPFDEWIENRKIYSKVFLRFIGKSENATVRVFISIDEGDWELVKSYPAVSTGGEMIPIVPRRCDRYSIKVEGYGDCEIKTLTRRVRAGSHGKL